MFNADQALRDWKHQKRHLPEFESDAPTCQIQWIDKSGIKSPDKNPAVCMVRLPARTVQINGRGISFPESLWYPCCAEHAKRLSNRGMELWECKPI